MNKLLALTALIVLSIALFVGVFSVVHRPLVVGEIQKQLDYKLAYASTLRSPKIVVFAGSNGRFSHRCEMLTQATGMPCVNASIGVGIGIDFLLDQWRPQLQAGDLVYMPLEYSQYRFSNAEMHGGLQNALMVHSQRSYLWSLEAKRIVAAYGSFGLPFLLHGIVEMGLEQKGFHRRSSVDSLTPQGDETGHTPALGEPYAAFVRSMVFDQARLPPTSDAIKVIEAFLNHAERDGVVVVGGLPTIPDSVALNPLDLEHLRKLYEDQGQHLLVLPNQSRYPLNCFFDTLNHLNETCQKAHSAAIGAQLAKLASKASRAP